MDYHLQLSGQDAGVFPIEELRRRRAAGELTGTEYVWGRGMPAWAQLDSVLEAVAGDEKTGAKPPPIPAGAGKARTNRLLILGIAAAALAVTGGTVFLGWASFKMARGARQAIDSIQSSGSAEAAAGKPIVVSTNTRTEKIMDQRRKEFRVRQYLDAYREFGQHTASWDSDALLMIESWINSHYGTSTNLPSSADLSNKLAAQAGCDDPLVLTVAASSAIELHERIQRLERALDAFGQSRYRAYPKFYAAVYLASGLASGSPRISELDASALKHFERALADGSLQAKDEEELAEILINGWGAEFFRRNADAVCRLVRKAKSYPWLALVLQGENEVKLAWKARGSGTANSVSREGWKGFFEHLGKGRAAFTEAWTLQSDRPLASASMIQIEMGGSGSAAEQMRTWFDRATTSQIDYPGAWTRMRWGLRPRWSGSHEALLALGSQAVKTGRFDTDVPRKFFDCVSDVESELELERGEHIYGRSDIWPNIKEMFEGYIAEPSQESKRNDWRSTYAAVAYLAGKYGVAREQLEAMNWKPVRKNLSGWGVDLSLMPLKVATLTGKSADLAKRAEASYARGNLVEAIKLYTDMNASAQGLEQEFSRSRLAALKEEEVLAKGEWIDLLPAADKDPNWEMFDVKARRLSDGAIEVESGPTGHAFYSRTRVGAEFEVTGEFEVVRTSTKDFQAGIITGYPDGSDSDWFAFRMKRNAVEGDLASFSRSWSKRQVARQVTLNSGRNSFQFRLRDGKADAWVNGTQVLEKASPMKTLHLHSDCVLGIGAYNDMNETVIRYSKVKVRRLVPGR